MATPTEKIRYFIANRKQFLEFLSVPSLFLDGDYNTNTWLLWEWLSTFINDTYGGAVRSNGLEVGLSGNNITISAGLMWYKFFYIKEDSQHTITGGRISGTNQYVYVVVTHRRITIADDPGTVPPTIRQNIGGVDFSRPNQYEYTIDFIVSNSSSITDVTGNIPDNANEDDIYYVRLAYINTSGVITQDLQLFDRVVSYAELLAMGNNVALKVNRAGDTMGGDLSFAGAYKVTNLLAGSNAGDAVNVTQLNTKQATITGGATTVLSSDLVALRALCSDASGKIGVASTTYQEIQYVNGVTSSIQTQLNTTYNYAATKLPLAGGTMTGSIVMGSNKITNLLAGTDAEDAVNLTQLNTKLSLSGGTMSGNLSMGSNKIGALADGITASEAVNRGQLETKQATITGAATSIVSADLTANRTLISDVTGKVAVSSIAASELDTLSGISSNIQDQFTSVATSIANKDLTGVSAGGWSSWSVINDYVGDAVFGQWTSVTGMIRYIKKGNTMFIRGYFYATSGNPTSNMVQLDCQLFMGGSVFFYNDVIGDAEIMDDVIKTSQGLVVMYSPAGTPYIQFQKWNTSAFTINRRHCFVFNFIAQLW